MLRGPAPHGAGAGPWQPSGAPANKGRRAAAPSPPRLGAASHPGLPVGPATTAPVPASSRDMRLAGGAGPGAVRTRRLCFAALGAAAAGSPRRSYAPEGPEPAERRRGLTSSAAAGPARGETRFLSPRAAPPAAAAGAGGARRDARTGSAAGATERAGAGGAARQPPRCLAL